MDTSTLVVSVSSDVGPWVLLSWLAAAGFVIMIAILALTRPSQWTAATAVPRAVALLLSLLALLWALLSHDAAVDANVAQARQVAVTVLEERFGAPLADPADAARLPLRPGTKASVRLAGHGQGESCTVANLFGDLTVTCGKRAVEPVVSGS